MVLFIGTFVREVTLEGAKYTTSCCFGGPQLDELFITTANHQADEAQKKTVQANSGTIFKITGLGVKGFSCEKFQDYV